MSQLNVRENKSSFIDVNVTIVSLCRETYSLCVDVFVVWLHGERQLRTWPNIDLSIRKRDVTIIQNPSIFIFEFPLHTHLFVQCATFCSGLYANVH